jgi:precorrin-2 dehydrogenase/sirohydrochlorin ferrochelatase
MPASPTPQHGYPLVLTNLGSVRCTVIGGGRVAERKTRALLDGGASPRVISPTLTPDLQSWAHEGRLEHLARTYRQGDLQGSFLVIAATNDPAANQQIAAEAASLSILANVADNPDAGDFHTVATVRQGEIMLGIWSGGHSPSLTAFLKRELEGFLGPQYARLLDVLRELREGPAQDLSPDARRYLFETLLTPTILRALEREQEDAIREYALTLIENLKKNPHPIEEFTNAQPFSL